MRSTLLVAVVAAAVLLTALAISSLHACDPGEKVRRVNSRLTEASAKDSTDPSVYYHGYGFPRSVEVSSYDGDCFPWVSGNGRYLLFASINFNGPCRPGHQGVWDIYRSEWDDANQCWGEAENLGPVINSFLDERSPSCNAECDTIYFHRKGLNHNANIYRSTYNGTRWSDPESLAAPVNTPANEEHPAVSADGMRLYFTSDRDGGLGGKDIWVAFWNGSEWESAVNLGPPINTPNEETRPFESFDEQRLYFTNQHAQPRAEGCYGGWGDIYVAFWTEFGWDNVSVVAAPVNNDLIACCPRESPDGDQLYFGSEAYEGSRGDEDIWVAERSVFWSPDTVESYGAWEKTGELENAVFVYDLKESPDGVIYAAAACADTSPMGRVFKTVDGGASWTPCADLPGVMIVYSLLFVADTIYAGTYPNGDVFKSIDGGASWVNTANLLGVTSVRALARLRNGDILVGTAPHDVANRNRIYRTTDGGMTWTERTSLTGINPCKFLYQASDGTLFAGGWGKDSYVFLNRSTDDGATWDSITIVPETHPDWSVDAFCEANDSTLYVGGWYPAQAAGTGGGYVYKSFDNGLTWNACSKVMRRDGVHNCRVYDIIEDSLARMYVGMQPAYDSVVFVSPDSGNSWHSVGGLAGAWECLCLLEASDGTVYAGTTPNGDVFKYLPTGVMEYGTGDIAGLQLLQNSPNPFSAETEIAYQLPSRKAVSIKIYNVSAEVVRVLADGDQEGGHHTVTWDGTDSDGREMPSGVYLCKLESSDYVVTRKLLLLR